MKKKTDYYIMALLVGISLGSVVGVVSNHVVAGVAFGSGIGVFIGGIVSYLIDRNRSN